MKRGLLALLLLAPACGGPQVIVPDAAVGAPAPSPSPAGPPPDASDAVPDRAPASDASPVAARSPDPRFLPTAKGPCPELTDGMITVQPGGVSRQVRIWISDAARTLDGPLVFYWHGTGGAPAEAQTGLGAAGIARITALGGIVAAPVHDPASGMWPWYLVSGTSEADLTVADEVLACAIQKVGVDLRHIHSVGFSAGAIQTVQLGYRRSGYIASVATYSGGQLAAIPDQDPTTALAAMIFHGGPADMVVVSFQMASEQYKTRLLGAGRFGFLCNHGMGHRIPTAAVGSVGQFLLDHPFGTRPSPYAAGLPSAFPGYCAL
jgi:predicted esterase